jgi:GMP reductase
MKFDYEDINLVPKLCIVNSRSECDTSIQFGKHKFKIPVVPANMECVLNDDIAIKLAKNGYFYIMHRFEVDIIEFIQKMDKLELTTSISVGVNDDSYKLIEDICKNNLYVDYVTIDIAHGHSIKVEKMIKFIKNLLPDTFVIAGNVSTPEAVLDLQDWGADSIKVGIGPGSACTTYPTTGFGSRNCQASTVYQCSLVATVPIIADGGIKVPGDITKSLVLGSTMVMVGVMLSGFTDSPGNVAECDGKKYKEFWGSASIFQSGKTNRIEGKKNYIPFKDKSILEEMVYLEECLQSSISYAGGTNLESFNNTKWIYE